MTRQKTAKGFFFTLLVVILFFFLLILSHSWIKTQQTYAKLGGVKARVAAMRGLIEALDADATRMAAIAGNRAAGAASVYASYNLTPIGNASAALGEIILNNTLNGSACYTVPVGTCTAGNTSCCFANQTQRASLSRWSTRFAEEIIRYDAAASFQSWSLNVTQGSAFDLRVQVNVNMTINDSGGAVAYTRSDPIIQNASVAGSQDPLYPFFTCATSCVRRTIRTPPAGYSPTSLIANGSNGNLWVYGSVLNINLSTNCVDLGGDTNRTLVANDVGPFISSCNSTLHMFRGVLFNKITGYSTSSIAIPWMNFSAVNISNVLANSTKVLIENNGTRHHLISVENLRSELTGEGYYRASGGAPSFMNRLQNNFSSSLASPGLESLVNYSLAAAYPRNSSWADFYYLNSTTCATTTCYKVKGTQNCENASVCANNTLTHFVLDDDSVFLNGTPNRLQHYGVENITLPG